MDERSKIQAGPGTVNGDRYGASAPAVHADWSVSLVRGYQFLLLALLAFIPLALIAYVQVFQDPKELFHSHWFHELAIGVAILSSAAITLVAFACYLDSGEPLLRWLTLGLAGFTLVYAPHGILTRLAADHPPLFLLFGPASRMVMAGFLFVGLLQQFSRPDPPEQRVRARIWWPWLAGLLVLDALIFSVANDRGAPHALLRLVMEGSAVFLSLAALAAMLLQRRLSPLLWFFVLGFCFFTQSSLSFFLARPWNHQWWLAHAIFAVGFMLISFGVVRAFLSTRKLVAVFSAEQWMEKVLVANAKANDALAQLHESNRQLEELANRDSLTGIWNRRHFMAAAEKEMRNALLGDRSLSLMIIDLDHFKQINDQYGHDTGDTVLKAFTDLLQATLRHHQSDADSRPADQVGRVGGEEFAAALPNTSGSACRFAAERLRKGCEDLEIRGPAGERIALSISVGVAAYPEDGMSVSELLRKADERLYAAKNGGRNQVRIA